MLIVSAIILGALVTAQVVARIALRDFEQHSHLPRFPRGA